jgi:hypothetical protein
MESHSTPLTPQLEFAFELLVNVGAPLEISPSRNFETNSLAAPVASLRRMIPILSGTLKGPHIAGRVLPGGADWQNIESDGLVRLDARYVIETDDGVRIEVRNQGIRHGALGIMERIAAGETVSPDEYYFRTTPRFYPPAGRYEWLARSIFIGVCERHAELVKVIVWKLA